VILVILFCMINQMHFFARIGSAAKTPCQAFENARICVLHIICIASVSGMTLSAAAQGVEKQAPRPTVIRVLSYNIHHGEGIDGKLDLERIAKVIQSSNADLIALQEVDRNTKRTGSCDQAAMLAELTTMHFAFGANIELQGGEYGNAVLSRFPITKTQNHRLPLRDNGEQRGALEVEIQYSPDLPPFTLIATHFDHRPSDQERIESATMINQMVATSDSLHAILAGDLNDDPASRTLVELETQWQCTNAEPLPTIPVDKPTRQIDFVLFRPTTRWTTIETRVLDEPLASDHRPILATLELRTPDSRPHVD
jgi:endonuclease/exonuclease/phosphatase family metal-dependent hydrolase